MIVLRNKQFAFGLNQLGRAISGVGKKGQNLSKMGRAANAAGGIGGLALTGLAVEPIQALKPLGPQKMQLPEIWAKMMEWDTKILWLVHLY